MIFQALLHRSYASDSRIMRWLHSQLSDAHLLHQAEQSVNNNDVWEEMGRDALALHLDYSSIRLQYAASSLTSDNPHSQQP